MKKNKVLLKAESLLNKYSDDNSKYYRELKKTYKEYKSLKDKDKVVNDLYINHINDLCDLISIEQRSNINIFIMLVVLVVTLIMSGYTTYKYFDIQKNLKNNIIKDNASSLVINYKNIESFNALELRNSEDYMDLEPIVLELTNSSKNKKSMHYDVYIIEENHNLLDNNIIPKKAFLYDAETNNRQNGVRRLSDAYENNGKIRLFSDNIEYGQTKSVNIRIWIDKDTKVDYKNKIYRFKIFVDGYAK